MRLNQVFHSFSRLLLALVYSSTNMLKSMWASAFWKPLVHTNMSKILENIEETDDETNDIFDQ